jgi:hypothetical protein
MTHLERCGNNLIVIHRESDSYDGDSIVVRWCTKCGAIVVDLDYDGRTAPGAVMKHQFNYSNLLFRLWRLCLH